MRWPLLAALLVASACSKVEPNPDPLVPSPPAEDGGPEGDPLEVWRKLGDEQLVRLFEEYGKARRGEAADLDGDGSADTVASSMPNGGMRWAFDPDQTGYARWSVEEGPGGELLTLIDADGDGSPELREEESADGRLRDSWEDTDRNGVMDERRTERVEAEGVRVTFANDSTENGTFTQTSEYVVPQVLHQGQAEGCEEVYPDPPPEEGETRIFQRADQPPFRMVVSRDDIKVKAACDDYDQSAIARALKCALGMKDSQIGFKCLERTNGVMAHQMRAQLLKKKFIRISCGIDCDTYGAATIGGGTDKPLINLNPQYLLDDADACATLFHELIHASGVAIPNKNHNDGDPSDRIYACELYCTGCREHIPPEPTTRPPPTANENCARCAGSPEERRQCGVEQKFTNLPKEECSDLLVCHGGIGTVKFCDSCKGTVEEDCIGQRLGTRGEFWCCATCPEDANRDNDIPCSSAGTPSLSTTCHDKPPLCP